MTTHLCICTYKKIGLNAFNIQGGTCFFITLIGLSLSKPSELSFHTKNTRSEPSEDIF